MKGRTEEDEASLKELLWKPQWQVSQAKVTRLAVGVPLAKELTLHFSEFANDATVVIKLPLLLLLLLLM